MCILSSCLSLTRIFHSQPKQPEGLGTPNMDTLMAKVEEPTALVNPPEAVMDRIHFVINNVTASNLSSKVRTKLPIFFSFYFTLFSVVTFFLFVWLNGEQLI